MNKNQLWVEQIGSLIIARLRGEPTAELLKECQEQVLALVKKTGKHDVLYDALEMVTPPVDVPLAQWELDKDLQGIRLRRAIVVPDTKLAYLARLAFAEGEHQVFYSDMVAAINWLSGHPAEK